MKKYIYRNGKKIDNPVYVKAVKQFQKEIGDVKRLYFYRWKDDPKHPEGGIIIETPTPEYKAFQKKWRKIFGSDKK